MRWISEARERLSALLFRSREDAETEEELRFHLEMEVEQNLRRGMSPEEARRRANVAFGGVQKYREQVRDARGLPPVEDSVRDLRYAARQLRRSPAFAAAAVLTLALGIGATTAIFSVVDSLLLHPLPFPGADRMVYVSQESPTSGMSTAPPVEVAEAWRRARSFDAAATLDAERVLLGGTDEPSYVGATRVSPGFLGFLGARPALGRTFAPEEVAAGGPDVALLGHGAWRRRFGGDPGVLGRTISLDGRPHTVVGVMPPSLARLPIAGGSEVWLPLRREAFADDDFPSVTLMARLRPGVTAEQAAAELDAIRGDLTESIPFFKGWRAQLRRPQDFVGDSLQTTLFVLLGAVGLVLLIACVNVAGLLLARAAGRGREMAIRVSLGASRRRLVRQLLVESLVLAALGGALGLLLALLGVEVITRMRPESLGELGRVGVDTRVLVFAGAASLLSALGFGVVPALRASGVRPSEELKGGGPGSIGSVRRTRLRTALVVVEVALSVVLLVGAGLLIRTLVELGRIDPGFRSEGLVAVRVDPPGGRYPDGASFDAFARALEERARAMPGVTGALVTAEVPLHHGISSGTLQVRGAGIPEETAGALRAMARVPAGYFSLLGIPMLEGRGFLPTERSWDDGVLILGEELARRIAPGGSAVGMQVRFGDAGDWSTVVGVAGDVAATSLRGEHGRLQYYVPFSGENRMRTQVWLVARAETDPDALAPMLRALVRSLDERIPVPEVITGEALLAEELTEPRFYAVLLGGFAALALALAAVGLFGVLSHAVRQRTREIGVRVALGASTPAVLGLVVRQGMAPALAGLAAGAILSLAATRLMQGLLYGVRPGDPSTLAAVGAVVGAVALVASYLPARRASRVDPMLALRAE